MELKLHLNEVSLYKLKEGIRLKADLHTHSTASDGINEPKENVRLAKEQGLAAFSITDHDTISGIDETVETGKKAGIEIVPGIEISTLDKGQDVHILGYFIQYKNKDFLIALDELKKVRKKRNGMMIEKLNKLGIQITMDQVKAKLRKGNDNIGRPHIGEVLIEQGIVGSLEEAFEEYLGRGGKAFINPVRISPEEGIDIIKKAGGVPVLAHPGLYDDDQLIVRLIKYGISGIEVYHPEHDEKDKLKYRQLTEKYKLLFTGGSDFHGSRNGKVYHSPIGSETVPYEVVKKLKELANKK